MERDARAGRGASAAVERTLARRLAEADEDPHAAVARAHLGARDALLALDRETLDAWLATLAAACVRASDARHAAWHAAVTALVGRRPDVAATQAAEREAARAGDALLTVELAALAALGALATGDLSLARSLARRACRMARAESLGQGEVLAHLSLSRVRRAMGHPHLAARICRGIAPLAPTSAWIAWERAMAGDAVEGCLITALIRAAASGDRGAFDRAMAPPPALPWIEDDHAAVAAAVDASRAAPIGLAPWLAGAFDRPPGELVGVCLLEQAEEHATVYVRCTEGGGRRLLAGGIALSCAGAVRLSQGLRKQGRVDSVVAALALLPSAGANEAEVFRAAYGFAYDARIHRGAFDVALHRARTHLEGVARLEREGGALRLVVERPFVVPDPRCGVVDERALLLLAERGGSTPAELAAALQLSVRVVQRLLAELARDGACTAERHGRNVVYTVEDTTFTEPTAPR